MHDLESLRRRFRLVVLARQAVGRGANISVGGKKRRGRSKLDGIVLEREPADVGQLVELDWRAREEVVVEVDLAQQLQVGEAIGQHGDGVVLQVERAQLREREELLRERANLVVRHVQSLQLLQLAHVTCKQASTLVLVGWVPAHVAAVGT
jgi:hypothetical protein